MKAKWTRVSSRKYATRLSDIKTDRHGRFQLPNGDIVTLYAFTVELGAATTPCLFRPIREWNATFGRTHYIIVNDSE